MALSHDEKCKAIDTFGKRIERQYLSQYDKNIPFDIVTVSEARLILLKLKLRITNPAKIAQDAAILGWEHSPTRICIEILQQSFTLRHHPKLRQWAWLFHSYGEAETLAYLLRQLCLETHGDDAETAWKVVDTIWEFWRTQKDAKNSREWKYFEELRSKALVERKKHQVIGHSKGEIVRNDAESDVCNEPQRTISSRVLPASKRSVEHDTSDAADENQPLRKRHNVTTQSQTNAESESSISTNGQLLRNLDSPFPNQLSSIGISHSESASEEIGPVSECEWFSANFQHYLQSRDLEQRSIITGWL
jgi:hypothetical protein